MDCCIVAKYPTSQKFDSSILSEIENVLNIVSEMRNIRNAKQIAPKEALNLSIKNNSGIDYKKFELVLKRLAMLGELNIVNEVPEND